MRTVLHGPVPRLLRDLLVVGLLAGAAVWATSAAPVGGRDLQQVLALAATAVGAAAAILADISARLRDRPRLAWGGAAFAVYSLVLIPSTTLVPGSMREAAGLQAARMIAYLTVLVLLLLALDDSRRGAVWGGWAVAGAGTILAVAAGAFVALVPWAPEVMLPNESVGVGVLVAWCCVAAVYAQQGISLDRAPLWRIGIGTTLLAGSHLYRLVAESDTPEPDTGFAALRLLGLLVVAVAEAEFWILGVRGVRADQERQAEDLRRAVDHIQRAADTGARRDHELRNGIGGLAGITAMLGSAEDKRDELRGAVLAELGRLSRMVDDGGTDGERSADVTAVLREMAVLHRARGIDVVAEVGPGVRAEVPDGVLRQVLANLLRNVELHASGASVELKGRREGTIAVVEVHDHGPGIPYGWEQAVLEEGVRDVRNGGRGLGLAISSDLLAEHDGTLTIDRRIPDEPGCRVVLTLVAAPEDRAGPAGTSSVSWAVRRA